MPSEFWGKQGFPPDVENKIVEKDKLKKKLEAKSMKELRDYVKEHNLKAKDTNKEELIEEILEEI